MTSPDVLRAVAALVPEVTSVEPVAGNLWRLSYASGGSLTARVQPLVACCLATLDDREHAARKALRAAEAHGEASEVEVAREAHDAALSALSEARRLVKEGEP